MGIFSGLIKKLYGKETKPAQHPEFRRVEASAWRSSWKGMLPQTPLCDHFLYLYSLTTPDEFGRFPPKRDRRFTHEIRISYKLRLASGALCHLHIGQYDFSGKPKDPAWVALKIALAIATEMKTTTDKKILLRSDQEEWERFIERTYKYLRCE